MVRSVSLQKLQIARRRGIGRLLLLARRDFLDRLSREMAVDKPAIDQARVRLLPYLDIDGTRSVDLAKRLGISKQAVGRLVGELEEDGLLRREADSGDGRAFQVKLTKEGLEYLTRLHRCITRIEREYDRLFGRERMNVVRDVLSLMVYGEHDAASLEPQSGEPPTNSG